MSKDIPLHPTRGLDPHLIVCPLCGSNEGGITVGHLFKAKVPLSRDRPVEAYATVYAPRGDKVSTAKRLISDGLIDSQFDLDWEEVAEGEKIPIICDSCQGTYGMCTLVH